MRRSTPGRIDDRYWIAGIFHSNRDDTAPLVPKCQPLWIGLGRTFNYARPRSWLLTVGPVLLGAFLVSASQH